MAFDYDSILITKDSNVLNRSEFYREGISQPDHTSAMKASHPALRGDDCMVGGLVVMFFVLAVAFYNIRTTLIYRIKDFFPSKWTYTDERVTKNTHEALNLFLLISISSLSLSVIFFDDMLEAWGIMEWTATPYWVFGVGYVVCMAFIYLKAWTYMFINWTFFDSEQSKRWMTSYLLLTALTAFVFYPIALMDVFSEVVRGIVTWSTILVVILYELLLFYKLFINFKAKKYGYLLNFLYFCTVELMPVLMVSHWLGHLDNHVIVKTLFH